MVKLEHNYFPPGTDFNNDFILRLINWKNIVWTIASIPRTEMDLAKKVAFECGLRIVDGVPHIFSFENIKSFPVDNERVFTLENLPDQALYQNNKKSLKDILAKEFKEMEVIFDHTMEKEKKKSAKKRN